MAEMGFGEAIRQVFSKYATFSGRARRAEYWWFALFSLLVSIGLQALDIALFGLPQNPGDPPPNLFGALFSLAILLPSLAVWVRRLHDVGRSGWWWLLVFVPVIGWIVLFYWSVRRGDAGPNAYGPDPIAEGGDYGRSNIPSVPRR